MKNLNPVNADSSASFTVEFVRNQVDFVPTDLTYSVCRQLVSDLSMVDVSGDIEVRDLSNLVEIVLTPEQLAWKDGYTSRVLVILKYHDEQGYLYTEGVTFEVTRIPHS